MAVSFSAGQDAFWTIGVPLGLAGQATLLVGLLIRLDVLGESSWQTSETLGRLDDQLEEVHNTTKLLQKKTEHPSQAFCDHLTDHAEPVELIHDLRQQLDLLATKVKTQEK